MPTLNACRRLYDAVDIAGLLNDTWGAPDPWLRDAEQRVRARNRLPALDEMVDAQQVPPPALIRGQPRIALGLRATLLLHFASALQRQRFLPPITAVDLLLGRGHHPNLWPDHNLGAPYRQFQDFYNRCSHQGLMGAIIESPPMRVATALEARGFEVAAALCVLGATVGRVMLQPARLVVAGAVIGLAISWAALTLFAAAGVEFLNDLMGSEYNLPQADLAGMLALIAFGIAFQMILVVMGPASIALNDSPAPVFLKHLGYFGPPPAAAATRFPILRQAINQSMIRYTNEDVARFMRRAIGRFHDQHVDDAAAARRMADRIFDDFWCYCASAPDDSAFRGGLSTLQNVMDLTYGDAQWRPTPDYELERFMQQALSPLRAPGVTAADAKTLAARLVQDLQRHFENEPTQKPVQSGLRMLEMLMHERFGGSALHAGETELS